jgi:NAD(P)-dependent dehydrogenase (short-subunit alcohol dehydrogenase family)
MRRRNRREEMRRLEGKLALVTGASTGIGRAIAERFAGEGAAVAVAAHTNRAAAEETLRRVEAAGSEGLVVLGDVADAAQAERIVAESVAALGGLDILVNNAGIDDTRGPVDVADLDVAVWDRISAVNLRGPFLVSKYALPHLVAKGGGAVLGIGSVGGLIAWPGTSAYSAAKAGLHALIRTIAVEYATRGVRANCICPGVIEGTALHEAYLEAAPDARELEATVTKLHPVGRLGRPEEIAALAVLLCSDEATFVTGALVPADGGFTTV